MGLRFSALFPGTVLAVSSLAFAAQAPKPATTSNAKSNQVKSTTAPVQSPTGPKTAGSNPVRTSSPSVVSVDALATVTAILSYCERIDKPNADFYQKYLSMVLSGHASSEIKVDENSNAYGAAVRLIDQQLAAIPVSSMVGSCKTIVP